MAPVSLLSVSPFVGVAHATHINCGDVLTANTTFDSNVGPCSTDGVVVGANNITIDLNGYRLFGISGPTDTVNVGVHLIGHTGVTITSSTTGGQIDNFDAGVAIDGTSAAASSNTVSNLIVRDNFPSGPVGGDFGDGVTIFGPQADNNTVSNNSIINNGPFSGVSVFNGTAADKITGTSITGNRVTDNRTQSSQTDGIRLESYTWSSTVSNNTVTGSALDGIALFRLTESNTVSNNVVTGNGASGDPSHRPGDGIHVFPAANNSTVTSNTVNRNAGNGIALDLGASTNTITNNTALNNAANPVLLVEEPPVLYLRVDAPIRGGVTATVGGNTVTLPPPLPANNVSGPWYDLSDRNTTPPCDSNTWSGNTYGTRNQTCIN